MRAGDNSCVKLRLFDSGIILAKIENEFECIMAHLEVVCVFPSKFLIRRGAFPTLLLDFGSLMNFSSQLVQSKT